MSGQDEERKIRAREAITIDQIRKAKPKKIYYAAYTCWWTHDPAHLGMVKDSGLPCDPRGAVLLETEDVEGFLKTAELSPQHYGVNGIATFIAAHHLNALHPARDIPWSERGWEPYDRAVTEMLKEKKS